MTGTPAGPGLQVREPGASIPGAVREAAARAGRRRQPADLRLLRAGTGRAAAAPRALPGRRLLTCRFGSVPVVLALKGGEAQWSVTALVPVRETGAGSRRKCWKRWPALDPEALQVIAEVIVLNREYPQWALWLPHSGRPWIAVRPASARVPGPELPMIWVRGGSAAVISSLSPCVFDV